MPRRQVKSVSVDEIDLAVLVPLLREQPPDLAKIVARLHFVDVSGREPRRLYTIAISRLHAEAPQKQVPPFETVAPSGQNLRPILITYLYLALKETGKYAAEEATGLLREAAKEGMNPRDIYDEAVRHLPPGSRPFAFDTVRPRRWFEW
jgi:hypothetical protein